jgi:hypothetical protein
LVFKKSANFSWRKIGEKLAKNWLKIGEKLAKNWRKIGAKIGGKLAKNRDHNINTREKQFYILDVDSKSSETEGNFLKIKMQISLKITSNTTHIIVIGMNSQK